MDTEGAGGAPDREPPADAASPIPLEAIAGDGPTGTGPEPAPGPAAGTEPAAEPAAEPGTEPAAGSVAVGGEVGPAWVEHVPEKHGRSWRVLVLVAAAVVVAIGAGIVANLPPADPGLAAAEEIFGDLPADVREQLAREMIDVAGDRFDGMTSAEVTEASARLTRAGFSRLSDEDLLRRLELQTLALERASTADCATFLRHALTAPTEIDLEAVTAILDELEEDELVEWYRLGVRAMTAEIQGTPPKRTVGDDAFFAALDPISSAWTVDELALIQAVGADPTGSTDADVCTFGDLLYGRVDQLSRDQQAVVALYDIAVP